ncbi:type II secretion system F family protein [Massilia sp. LXY-6]|uniref:type II secretion system F family protein n=1 Tax=Massilia sp. LXY-6 TaxID=3379823 RepID=UPI003EE04BF7
MSDLPKNDIFPVISILVFLTVMLLMEAIYLFWRTRRGAQALRLNRRLDLLSQSGTADGQRTLLKQRKLSDVSAFARLLNRLSFVPRLERYLAQSGLSWTVSSLVLTSGTAAAMGIAIAALTASPVFLSIGYALVLGSIPWTYVGRARAKRLRKLENQLPDALDLITRAMRAGHSLPLGIQLLTEEMPNPIASEFRHVHEQVSFGVSLQQALSNLCDRVPLTDFRYFVVSILIQRQSGGNLTEVLGNLSRLIRERLRLLGRVRVLSAEGRMSAWVLGVLPFFVGALLQIFNPDFMGPFLTDPLGIKMLQTLLSMMAVGAFFLSRIVKIRV